MLPDELSPMAPLPIWLENRTNLAIFISFTNSFSELFSQIPRMFWKNPLNYTPHFDLLQDGLVFLVNFCQPFVLFKYLENLRNVKFSWNHKSPFLIVPECKSIIFEPETLLKELWINFGIINPWIYWKLQWLTVDPLGESKLIPPKSLNEINNLKGWTLRVSLFERIHSAYIDSNGIWAGDELSILEQCVQCMNATYYFVPSTNEDRYLGSFQAVSSSKSDILIISSFVHFYMKGLGFSIAVDDDALCVVVPRAQPLTNAWALVRSLPGFAKVYVFSSFVILILIEYAQNILTHKSSDLISISVESLRIFLGFSSPTSPKNFLLRLRFICLFYLGYLFATALQIKLIPSLTKPQYGPEINTVEELLDSGYSIRIGSSNLFDTFSGDDAWGKLKNRVVLQAFNQDQIPRGSLIRLTTLKTEPLDPGYHLVSECPSIYTLAYVIKVGEAWEDLLNKCLQRIVNSGLINFLKIPEYDVLRKQALSNLPLKARPLALEDLQIAFILFFFGIGISILVHIISCVRCFKKKCW